MKEEASDISDEADYFDRFSMSVGIAIMMHGQVQTYKKDGILELQRYKTYEKDGDYRMNMFRQHLSHTGIYSYNSMRSNSHI